MDFTDVNLTNISNGAAEQLFQRELQACMRNMDDINTPHAKARKITLEITFKPNADRDHADIELNCKSTLAPVKGVAGSMYFNKTRGKFTASTRNEEEEVTGELFDINKGV